MIHKYSFHAMGTQVTTAVDSQALPEEIEQVPWWFEEWEQALSRFRSDSELSVVNDRAGSPMQVSRIFADVFEASKIAEHASAGLVTPVLLDELVLAGYDRSFDLLKPEQAATSHSIPFSQPHRLNEISWNDASRTICLPSNLRLDFGGVAKGWAAHQTAIRLKDQGSCLIDAGGDIAISGMQSSGSPWLVGIADPFDPEMNLEVLQLGKCGVATSGRDKRRWKQGSRLQHHLIDPRTGSPAETDILTTTIVAPTVMAAEMASKTVTILGSDSGLEWLQAKPNMSGVLVLENGSRLYNNMEKYIWRENVD